MKLIAVASVFAALLVTQPAQAFKQATHKRFVLDAVSYMQAHPETTEFAALQALATAAGYTVAQFAEVLGQGAYDVDDFQDTYFCGAITGNCTYAPVFNAGASLVNYTSYWHFQNHTRGPDVHGNDLGGYNYELLTVWGDIDNLAATWLVGDYMDDGPGGMTGWWSNDSPEYDTYGVTEANYRQGTTSSKSMYDDFEEMPFQPLDNLAQYWYDQFIATPTAQSLGFALHATDLLQPHHVWTTSALNHSGWEGWVEDYYDSENLADEALITQALADFTPLSPSATDIRPLLTQGGALAYANGGIVLSSTDQTDRVQVGQVVVPHAIAMVVHLLNHAVVQMTL
ncbi:phospholipase C/P1 nuclease family protein [Alloalcanivorax mobilis]|uniref:phospholipase n=1 Tax=Alloalcanivorax mobilis TaxID=2019569 RepID=UPI000B5B2738|nr:phospholipase [Alloalcanivorax mobilis]ASK33403.1 phospholipase [Alcanivorax sp. N3-2A]